MKFTNEIKSIVLKNTWKLFKNQSVKTTECFNKIWSEQRNNAKNGILTIEVKPIEVKPEIKVLDFNKIYRDNYKYVCNVIKSKTDNKNDIDLIANDVFLQVNKVLSTIQIDKDIKPFLFQIAKNKVVDFYRSEFKHSYKTTDKVSDFIDEKGNEYRPTIAPKSYDSNQVENQELNDKINSEIAKLGTNANDILTMYYIDGMKYKEIAEILNVSTSFVGVVIHRAKDSLKSNLSNDYQMIKEDYLYE